MQRKLGAAVLMAVGGVLCMAAVVCGSDAPAVRRVNNRSPVFRVPESDVDFFMNYTGFSYTNRTTGEGQRFFKENIGPKVLSMLDAAERYIILSVFLFDSLYATEPPERDIVKTLSDKPLVTDVQVIIPF